MSKHLRQSTVTDALRQLVDVRGTRIEELESKLSAAERELESLRATVAKLPRTADGVPVTPGMTLWHQHSDDGFAGPNTMVVIGHHEGYWYTPEGKTNFQMFSTREAAETGVT